MAFLIIAVHLAAAFGVALTVPGYAGLVLAAALAALGLAAAWARALLRAAASCRVLELGEGAGATIELAGGAKFTAEVDARRYVSRHLVVLPLVRPVRRTILVSSDMLRGDSFRKLRVWALWGRTAVAGKQLPT